MLRTSATSASGRPMMAIHAFLWLGLVLAPLATAAPIEYAGCSCNEYNGAVCACEGGGDGCTCDGQVASNGAIQGICSSSRCLSWPVIGCHQQHDPSLPDRPLGSDCAFKASDEGGGLGSYSTHGKCMYLNDDGTASSNMRCSRTEFWLCQDQDVESACEHALRPLGATCGRDVSDAANRALRCYSSKDFSCLGLTDGTACSWLFVDSPPYPTQHFQPRYATLEVTQGQILSQSPTDATRFWWHLYGS